MANILNSNNGVSKIVAVLILLIVTAVLVFPMVKDMGEPVEKTYTHTIANEGVPFAIADADAHTLSVSVDGDAFVVTADGNPVSTAGLGTLLKPSGVGPFNSYYGAFNLTSGDNSDDAGEERLSKEKGAMAYLLNPNNLHQTLNGYTFDPTLYNVMFVIPPVYWYSELDSGSTETGKLYMASSPDAFESMGISASNMKDYAHTYTDNGVVGHAPAIAIGVYEGYDDNGVLTSQSGRTPTANVSLTNFVPLATAGNTDNDYGTYQLWNYYMWTLYRMMGFTVMGNMDSQYMMGQGPTDMSESSVTGLTSSAYEKSANAQSSVSLFLENTWGSVIEFVGDTKVSNYVLSAGNTLGGSSSASSITNVLGETVTLPTISGQYYATFNPSSEVFGAPATVGAQGTPGQAINDYVYTSSSTNRVFHAGGYWQNTSGAGSSYVYTRYDWTDVRAFIGSRLAYVITDSQYSTPIGADNDYAYILSYNTNGTVSDVQSIENGTATSYMPDGTTLNSYWDFNKTVPSDATSSLILAIGSDALLKVYDSGDVMLYTTDSAVNLGKATDIVNVSVNNGTITYTGGSATISLYRSNAGAYVYATAPVKVLKDATVRIGQYTYDMPTANGSTDIGYAGMFTASSLTDGATSVPVTVLAPSVAPQSTDATVNSTSDNYVVTVASVSVSSTYTDDTSSVTFNQMFVPATATYDEIVTEPAGGIVYEIVKFLPLVLIICLFASFVVPMARR